MQAGGEGEFVAPGACCQHGVLGFDVALRSAYSCDAAGVGEERERDGVGPVDCAVTLRGLGEGACGVRRTGLPIGGAVAARDDVGVEAGDELQGFGAVYET